MTVASLPLPIPEALEQPFRLRLVGESRIARDSIGTSYSHSSPSGTIPQASIRIDRQVEMVFGVPAADRSMAPHGTYGAALQLRLGWRGGAVAVEPIAEISR